MVKLASLDEGRDGRLVVVSRDLTRCISAAAIVDTLQEALDDWHSYLPRLEAARANSEQAR
jgi:fumarylacetoacetate (FAA) hydrolase